MTKQLCENCKHLETDGMFVIFCGVGGDNTNYDCSKYEQKMTEKRYYIGNGKNCTICDNSKGGSDFFNMLTQFQAVDELNRLHEENKQLKQKNTMLSKDLKYITDRKNHLESEWDKFYELVDKKIKELEDKYEFGRTEYRACPMHNIMFGINVLKELTKELKE